MTPEEQVALLGAMLSSLREAPGNALLGTRLEGRQGSMEHAVRQLSGCPRNRHWSVTTGYWLVTFNEAGAVEAYLQYKEAEQRARHAEVRRAYGLREGPIAQELMDELDRHVEFAERARPALEECFPPVAPSRPPTPPVLSDDEDVEVRAEMLGRRWVQPIPIQQILRYHQDLNEVQQRAAAREDRAREIRELAVELREEHPNLTDAQVQQVYEEIYGNN